MTGVLDESRSGAVATLTMARPGRLNALDRELAAALCDALGRLDADPEVRAIVLAGAGRGFCAGADVADLAQAANDLGDLSPGTLRTLMLETSGTLAARLLAMETPLVAAVNGPCAGAGVGVAMACDLVVAGRSATFSVLFARRGLVPDYGVTWLLPRLVGMRAAKELCLLGDDVGADRALELGLVTSVVDDAALEAEAAGIAARLADGPTGALRLTKALLRDSFERTPGAAVEAEFTAQSLAFASVDAREGTTAFLEKRPPRFTGR